MNAAQRKIIQAVHDNLTNDMTVIESERDAEQEKFDNMPESLQSSDKGEAMQAGIDALTEAYDAMEQALQALDQDSIGL